MNDNQGAAPSHLRDLPSVDELVRSETAVELAASHGERYVTKLARTAIEHLRGELREAGESDGKHNLNAAAERLLLEEHSRDSFNRIQRVINATGVMIHTNLGRAPLSDDARQAILEASGYTTVEYDLASGGRGKRGVRAESLLCELTGAEAAMIVNNCAAAAFLVLSVFASGGEVVISRGELVEIGGDFRIPDVLTRSGASLREVGTTNRTRISDYESALSDKTRMILKVHPSNYRIVGFSSAPSISEMAALTKKGGVIFYEDAGSGALLDLSDCGVKGEPIIAESISAGVDLVSFSGDKLLGGCQAGIIAGKKELIDQIRKDPLYRALRVDKLAYAVLESTLESYRKGTAIKEIPVLRMISMTTELLAERAGAFGGKLAGSEFSVEIFEGNSVVGGGSAPDFQPLTSIIALSHSNLSAERLEYALRHSTPPVIARIVNGRVVLDLRTVSDSEEAELVQILRQI